MKKEDIINALKELRKNSKKRNFDQSVELIVNLKDINIKDPENKFELFINLPTPPKKNKICCFTGPESFDEAKQVCDKVIHVDEFKDYDKKKAKKLASEYDFFIAQANIMPKVASIFGKFLGPKGKMPNPKAGAVFPPKANIKVIYDKLSTTSVIRLKNEPSIKCCIGKESFQDEKLAENIEYVYSTIVSRLSKGEQNIKNVLIKFTMSKPVKVNVK